MGALISVPISMAASCAGSLFGSCCTALACKACSCACVATARASSVVYISLMAVAVVAALSFGGGGGDIVLGGTYNATADHWIDQMKAKAMGTVSGTRLRVERGAPEMHHVLLPCRRRLPRGRGPAAARTPSRTIPEPTGRAHYGILLRGGARRSAW